MNDVIIIGGSFAGLAAALRSAVPVARSSFSIPVGRVTALPAIRMVCSVTITRRRWTSWPRRGSS